MTTGISLGTSTADWQMWQQEQMNATKAKMNKSGYVSKTDSSNNTQQVQVTKTSENTCTDGNDDGKIGFFAAAGHAIKGAAKGLWNGIKGCFTNSEGKFSLGKTLLTVGMGALCIAFPAVGLVACGIGAVSGAVTLGKGIYNAATAETDAEAKDAWENIGDGAFTVATSVVGAKASFKAVKATSTAGISSVDDAAKAAGKVGGDVDKIKNLDNVDDAIKAVKEMGGDTSKLGNLAEDATKLDKAKALLSDSWSSTKNQGKIVLAKGTELKNEAKLNKEAKAYNENSEKIRSYKQKINDGTITPEEYKNYQELCKQQGKVDQTIRSKADDMMIDEAYKTNEKINSKAKIDEQKGMVDALENNLKEMKKTHDKDSIKVAKQWLNEEKANLKQVKKDNSTFGQLTNKAKTAVIEKSETAQYLNNQKATLTEGLNKKSILHPVETAKQITETAKKGNLAEFTNALSKDGQAIITFLGDNGTYVEAVQKFGYSNVAQVLEAFAGYRMADESI